MTLLLKIRLSFLLGGMIYSLACGASREPQEQWILTKEPSKTSWKNLLAPIKDFELLNTFGPHERYALVRSKGRNRTKLPKEIVSLQRNYTYEALEKNDPDFNQSWGLLNEGQNISTLGAGLKGVDVGAVKAWQLGQSRKLGVIAILDSGIDLRHPDLQNNLWFNKLELDPNGLDDDHNGFINDLNGWNFADNTAVVQDDNNHGTAVAGVLAADAKNGKGSRGLLENAQLMIVKILDQNGTGTTERAVKGIEYAVNNGAQVINASWGGTLFDQVLFDTIQWANDKGVLFVCAAGNEPKDNDTDDRPIYPASFHIPNVVSVAAHDSIGELASFSSYGKKSVHLAAPGVAVYVPVREGYRFVDGTSFAAPFVAAASSLLKSFEPNLSPSQLRERLIKNAVPMDYYTKEKLVSAGRLDVFSLLKNITTPSIATPTEWKRIPKTIESQHPYLNDTYQVFEITQPDAKHLRAHFTKIDLEKSYDKIYLKDHQGKIAVTYTGSSEDFWSADVLGDVLKIELVTDFSNPKWGFSIDAVEYSL